MQVRDALSEPLFSSVLLSLTSANCTIHLAPPAVFKMTGDFHMNPSTPRQRQCFRKSCQ